LKYHPNDPNVSFYLGGWVYYSKKEYGKAIETFDKSIKQGMPEFRVLVYMGSAYQHKGDQEKARVFYDSSVSACQMILEKEPENCWALSELGLTYAFLGNEKEAIENGKTGLLVKAGDSTALAEAILLLLNEEELYKSIKGLARERTIKLFSWERIVQNLSVLYEKICDCN